MSEIGYYRYKTDVDIKTINWTVNYVNVGSKTITPVAFCEGGKILKYLDSNGQYRFYPFNKYYQTTDTPVLIGKSNKLITSILTDQSNTQNVGYKNERILELVADVPTNELEKLTDIYTSPRVYLYNGNGVSDIAKDWLEVTIQANESIVKRRKSNSGRIGITVTLPEHFTIKMI